MPALLAQGAPTPGSTEYYLSPTLRRAPLAGGRLYLHKRAGAKVYQYVSSVPSGEVDTYIVELSKSLIVIGGQLTDSSGGDLAKILATFDKPVYLYILPSSHCDHLFGVPKVPGVRNIGALQPMYSKIFEAGGDLHNINSYCEQPWEYPVHDHDKNSRVIKLDVSPAFRVPTVQMPPGTFKWDSQAISVAPLTLDGNHFSTRIEFKNLKLLYLSDLYISPDRHPFISSTGEISAWAMLLSTLQKSIKRGYLILPGHGALLGDSVNAQKAAMYLQAAGRARASSPTALQYTIAMLRAYPGLKGREVLLKSTLALYGEKDLSIFKATTKNGPLDGLE